MFPISLTGSVRVPQRPDTTVAAEKIARWLDGTEATAVETGPGWVRFEAPLAGTLRSIGPFDSGIFRLEIEDVAPRVVSALVAGLVVAGLLLSKRGMDWRFGVELFAAGWLWLFGMNYLMA